MSTQEDVKPQLASLVRAGDQQKEAELITENNFMSNDISIAYLVTTRDCDHMVNTGFMDNAQRPNNFLEPKRTGPLRYFVLTKAHAEHY